jgi:hypothetical protein
MIGVWHTIYQNTNAETESATMTFPNMVATNGSTTVPTKSHSFQAKDGCWYPTYMEKVTANRAYNDAVLKSKGLLDTVATIQKQQQQQRRTTNNKNTSENRPPRIVTPVRRSSRISTKDDDPTTASKRKFQALEFNADDTPILQPRRRNQEEHLVSTPPPAKKQRRTSQSVVSYEYTLSDQESLALQQLEEASWLNDMDHWLRTVPHGNAHKVVSADNARNVMNQVRKLVTGEGITYHHWASSSVSFKKGISIHLGQNMEELFQQAQDMEDTHGRDLGNGWLLRHPIRKLQLYQDYRRLSSQSR